MSRSKPVSNNIRGDNANKSWKNPVIVLKESLDDDNNNKNNINNEIDVDHDTEISVDDNDQVSQDLFNDNSSVVQMDVDNNNGEENNNDNNQNNDNHSISQFAQRRATLEEEEFDELSVEYPVFDANYSAHVSTQDIESSNAYASQSPQPSPSLFDNNNSLALSPIRQTPYRAIVADRNQKNVIENSEQNDDDIDLDLTLDHRLAKIMHGKKSIIYYNYGGQSSKNIDKVSSSSDIVLIQKNIYFKVRDQIFCIDKAIFQNIRFERNFFYACLNPSNSTMIKKDEDNIIINYNPQHFAILIERLIIGNLDPYDVPKSLTDDDWVNMLAYFSLLDIKIIKQRELMKISENDMRETQIMMKALSHDILLNRQKVFLEMLNLIINSDEWKKNMFSLCKKKLFLHISPESYLLANKTDMFEVLCHSRNRFKKWFNNKFKNQMSIDCVESYNKHAGKGKKMKTIEDISSITLQINLSQLVNNDLHDSEESQEEKKKKKKKKNI